MLSIYPLRTLFTLNTKLALITLIALTPQISHAKSCAYYQERIDHYEQMRRAGGTAKQMNRWQIKSREMEEQLRRCKNNPETNPSIQIASGTKSSVKKQSKKIKHPALKSSDSLDSLLQGLIKTCNYWITTTKQEPSQNNLSFRDSACSAVEKREQELGTPFKQTRVQLPARKLKDCIKPNKVIDNEVNECVMGTLEPTWKSNALSN